jgi:hypothetical protein
MATTGNVPLLAGAPAWGAGNYGIRPGIAESASRRAWWVFRCDTVNNKLYYRGSTYYKDATFDDISLPGWCLDYIACDITEQFGASTSNQILFPLYDNSGVFNLGGSGTFYWVNYDVYCGAYNDTWAISYQTGSRWEVLALGDVKVPHGGGTTYPYCLLVKLAVEIGPQTQIVHTGQLMYQWIDTDTGMVVAFIMTHNEGNTTVGIPFVYGYTGDQVTGNALIGAWN